MAVTVQGDEGRRYSDGQWHSITVTRRGAVGTIVVDNQYRGKCSHIHQTWCVCGVCVCVSVFLLLSTWECDVTVREMCLCLFMFLCMCVNPSSLHGGISQVNPSHSLSDEKNTSSHPDAQNAFPLLLCVLRHIHSYTSSDVYNCLALFCSFSIHVCYDLKTQLQSGEANAVNINWNLLLCLRHSISYLSVVYVTYWSCLCR